MFAGVVLLTAGACGDDSSPDAAIDAGREDIALDVPPDVVRDATDADLEDARDAMVSMDGGLPTCPEALPMRAGSIAEPDLNELSGLVASRTQPGVFFAINDSGPPDIYAIDESGASLGRYRMDGAENYDFEDIAIGPGPGGEAFVFVADVGDNMARLGGTPRDEVRVYGVPEPIVGESLSTLTGVQTFRYTHETPVDVEAIAIDTDGTLVMLTKELGVSRLVRGMLTEGPTQLQFVSERDFSLVTAMDFGPEGLLVRTYADIYHFAYLGDVETTYGGEFLRGRPGAEFQGEAIAWRGDGTGLITASEGAAAPVFAYHCR